MAQLYSTPTHLLPARPGRAHGLEITPSMRHAALRACGVKQSVACAVAAGLVTVAVDAEARVLAQRKGLTQC